MAEKILKTRIQLKYDTLTNWTNSTFKLKSGELAIVTLGETKDGTTAGDANQHPVLFKVGTGNHTFNQLPYASALAADVYSWAKASDVVLEGKVLKFVGTNPLKTISIPYITSEEATNLINTALADYSTTTQMNEAIKTEADRAQEAEKALGERIDAFNLPEGGFASKTDFEALKGKVEDEDGALAKATAAEAALAIINGSGAGSLAKVLQDAKDYADANDANATYSIAYDSTNKKIQLVGANGGATTEIDATAFIKDGMVSNVEIKGDNLVITFNTDAGEDAIEVPIGYLVDVYTGVDGTTVKVVVSSDNKISAEVKDGTIKNAHIASDAAIAKTKLASDVQTSLGKADSALQAADIGTMAKETATDYVKKSDATGYDDILTKTQATKAYVDKQTFNGVYNNLNGLINDVATDLANNYSTTSQNDAKYATTAQGTKADTAIQSVTSVANNGIKATTTGTSVSFDWDPNVVFVFDCGNAGGWL